MWTEQCCQIFKNDSDVCLQIYCVCVCVCVYVSVWSVVHVMSISSLCVRYSQDPLVNLNYTVFLYNRGERKLAAKQFSLFEQKHKAQGQVEIDSEVSTAHVIFDCVCAQISMRQQTTCNLLHVWVVISGSSSLQLKCPITDHGCTLKNARNTSIMDI